MVTDAIFKVLKIVATREAKKQKKVPQVGSTRKEILIIPLSISRDIMSTSYFSAVHLVFTPFKLLITVTKEKLW